MKAMKVEPEVEPRLHLIGSKQKPKLTLASPEPVWWQNSTGCWFPVEDLQITTGYCVGGSCDWRKSKYCCFKCVLSLPTKLELRVEIGVNHGMCRVKQVLYSHLKSQELDPHWCLMNAAGTFGLKPDLHHSWLGFRFWTIQTTFSFN